MRTMNPSAPLPSSDSVAYTPVETIVTSMDDMLVDDDKSDQFVPFPPAGAAEVSHETSEDYHENQKKYEPLLNRSIAESNPTPHRWTAAVVIGLGRGCRPCFSGRIRFHLIT